MYTPNIFNFKKMLIPFLKSSNLDLIIYRGTFYNQNWSLKV